MPRLGEAAEPAPLGNPQVMRIRGKAGGGIDPMMKVQSAADARDASSALAALVEGPGVRHSRPSGVGLRPAQSAQSEVELE